MTCRETKSLVNDYIKWLSEQFSVEDVPGACEITTPFVDRHNDAIVIYVEKSGDQFVLSDEGYTLHDLSLSGVRMTAKREEILSPILKSFGVVRQGNELTVITSPEEFPLRKHELLQAILSVNDMFMIGQERVGELFFEEVKAFLEKKRVGFSESVDLEGASGMEHRIHFRISPSGHRPEQLIQAIGAPDRQAIITRVLYPLKDIKERREGDIRMHAVLNDKVKMPSDLISHVKNGGAIPTLWSKREALVEALSA